MKRLAFVIVCLFVVSATAPAQLSFGGGAQVGISISSFPKAVSDYYGLGFGGGAHGDLNILKFLSIRLNLDYHTFSSKKDKMKDLLVALAQQQGIQVNPGDLDVSGLNASLFGITVNGLGRIPTGSPITPYGLLGLGMHIGSISDLQVKVQGQPVQTGLTSLKSETNFGLNFGAGSEVKVGIIKLYLEVKYVLIFSSGESTSHIPIMVGVTIGG